MDHRALARGRRTPLALEAPVRQAGETALWHIDPARPAIRAALGCDARRSAASSLMAVP
jgi:hypothetical protein